MSERWPALMTREEAAEYLGIGKSSMSLLIAKGDIRGVKFYANGQPRYKRSDLDELIESLEYGQGECSANKKGK